jgi:hypothetical protein
MHSMDIHEIGNASKRTGETHFTVAPFRGTEDVDCAEGHRPIRYIHFLGSRSTAASVPIWICGE